MKRRGDRPRGSGNGVGTGPVGLGTGPGLEKEQGVGSNTLIPDFLTGPWQIGSLSAAAARGAARSELFRAHHCSHFASQNSPVGSVDTPTWLLRGERSLWPSLPHRPREVNRRVAGHVGPEKLSATLPRASAAPVRRADLSGVRPRSTCGRPSRARSGSDAGVAQEAARRRATRWTSLAAHVPVRGMAEAGR